MGRLRLHQRHNPFIFGGGWGYYYDFATGLYQLGARYYDPGTGKFASRDPIGTNGGENLYGYAGDDPVNEVDPSGDNAVIIYGSDSKSGNTYFHKAALALAAQYESNHPGQIAAIFYANGTWTRKRMLQGAAVFNYALGVVPQIDTIMWLGHAGITNLDAAHPHLEVSKLYTGSVPANDITTAAVAHFPTKNVEAGSSILLFGCDTAATLDPVSHIALSAGQISIAKAFAERFGTSVQGFTEHVGFGVGWQVHLGIVNYDVYHNRGRSVSPVAVNPR